MKFDEYVGFKLNNGVRVSLDAMVTYPFHLHSNVLELVGLVSGAATVSDCAMDYHLAPGDVYIFNPKDPHRLVSRGESLFLTVQIDRDAFATRFPQLKKMYFICQPFQKDRDQMDPQLRQLRFFMARLWVEYSKPEPGEWVIGTLTEQLIETLLGEFTQYRYRKAGDGLLEIVRQPVRGREKVGVQRDYDMVDLIYSDYNKDISLAKLAKAAYVSESHLSRSLKKTVGLTFSELLSLARCEEAERLLFATEKNVDEIADQVGFANRKHLAINFKKWYKKTPTDFRNVLKKDRTGDGKVEMGQMDEVMAKKLLERWLDGK